MKLRRDETFTGLLVLVTAAVVAAVVLALSAPGLFRSSRRFHVLFDNAAGLQPGTYVLLAGRRVGQVVELESPVPLERRPEGRKELEVLVTVRVRGDARIYRSVTVRMQEVGLLGQQTIDFVNGEEASGPAEPGTTFIGERVATLNDAAAAAKLGLEDLRQTIANVNELTGPQGDLRKTAANAREFTDTIKHEPWRLLWKSKRKDDHDHDSR